MEGSNLEIDSNAPRTLSKRKRTAESWMYFDLIIGEDNQKITKCKKCGKEYTFTNSGTNTMRRHTVKCEALSSKGQQQSPPFNYDIFRELMCRLVIKHDLPFQFYEWDGVREVISYARGQDMNIGTRNTCKADCLKLYRREMLKVKNMINLAPRRICFTSDCWSSITTEGYICLTAHFIDKDWCIHKRVLNLSYMPPPHSGVCLSDKLISFFIAWGVDKRIMTITMDNATANDSCVSLLKSKLRTRGGLFFEGKYIHIRCCAHIINLFVQDGLKEKVLDPAVKKVRETVKYIKGSQARKQRFLECVGHSSLDPKRGLPQDVPTRWNSTYTMLDNALYYRAALTHFAMSDSNYKDCPSSSEWDSIEKMCSFLGVFYDITCVFSGSKYPTANLYFPGVFSTYITLCEAKKSSDEFMKAMAGLMYDKFKKYWTDFSEILAIAVILDPHYKMKFVEWCYEKVYGEMDGSLKVMELKEKLFSLFNEYGAGNSSFVSNSSSSSSQLVQGSENQGTSQYFHAMGASFSRETRILLSEFKYEVGVILQKSELEQYLEEPISDSNLNMDILTFWKGSELRYPRLASMARDVLSIPISTVASESAFSAGGRVLDQYRSVLKPETVEALVCTKDWLYGSEELEKQNNLFEELTRDVLVMRHEVNHEESCSSNTDSLSVIGHENRW